MHYYVVRIGNRNIQCPRIDICIPALVKFEDTSRHEDTVADECKYRDGGLEVKEKIEKKINSSSLMNYQSIDYGISKFLPFSAILQDSVELYLYSALQPYPQLH